MKTLQNNFTTPEQSKRLLELGVPADSADCYYDWYGTEIELHPYKVVQVFNGDDTFTILKDRFKRELLPCWSVGRLMEIFDMCYQREPEECVTEHWILTQEAIENFGSYIEYLVQTFSVQKNYLDFSKLED